MEFWKKLFREISLGHEVVLMYVLKSEGSSPGRQGFKMFVSNSGVLYGSIGGGMMEHKLVELCKRKLESGKFQAFIRQQIHRRNISKDRSGAICSGEQTIGFHYLNFSSKDDLAKIASLPVSNPNMLILDQNGLRVDITSNPEKNSHSSISLQMSPEANQWELRESLSAVPELHIIGGGHVSLALSNLGSQFGFHVYVYDNRNELNTIKANAFAEFVYVPNYGEIGNYIDAGQNKYVVLVSFGFRTDKISLEQLLSKNFKYIGLMGSKGKIKTLFEEMISDGADTAQLKKVHAPIGIQISSKTPMEIALSIMAEIIKIKNDSFKPPNIPPV